MTRRFAVGDVITNSTTGSPTMYRITRVGTSGYDVMVLHRGTTEEVEPHTSGYLPEAQEHHFVKAFSLYTEQDMPPRGAKILDKKYKVTRRCTV